MEPPKLSEIAASTGLLVLVGAVLSVGYETRFAEAVGVSLSTLPITPEDYTRSVAVWLPGLVVGLALFFVLEGVNVAVEGGRTEEEIAALSRNPRFIRRFRNSPYYFIAAVSVIACILSVLGIRPKGLPSSIVWLMAWIYAGGVIMTRAGVRRRFNLKILLGIYFSIACFLYTFQAADFRAIKVLNAPLDETIVFTDGSKLRCRIVRRYSGFLLARIEGSDAITVVPADTIRLTIQKD